MRSAYRFSIAALLTLAFTAQGFSQLLSLPRDMGKAASAVGGAAIALQANDSTSVQETDESQQDELPQDELPQDESQQDESQQDESQQATEQEAVSDETLIRLQCNEMPWKQVIEFFTDKTNLSLQPIAKYPEGGVTILDDRKFTVMEGLDQLNLRLRLEEYTLVRNENLLFFVEIRDIEDNMVQTVQATDLESRGRFEVMRAEFNLAGLDYGEYQRSIEALVSDSFRRDITYVPASNKVFVTGIGQTLRSIGGMFSGAQKEVELDEIIFARYELKHYPPRQILTLVAPLMDLDPDDFYGKFEDGVEMRISFDELDRYINVVSSRRHIKRLFDLLDQFDKPAEELEMGPIAEKYLATHPVSHDPLLAFQVLQTQFEGRDVRMEQDQKTGDIVLFGTAKDHADAELYLAALNSPDRGTKVIELKHKTQSEMITILNGVLGISDTLEEGTASRSDLRLVPIPDSDRLVVVGSPSDVVRVESLVIQLDIKTGLSSSIRSNYQIVPMSNAETEDIFKRFGDYFPSTNRKNTINLVYPDERKKPRDLMPTPEERLEQLFEGLSPDSDNSMKVPDSSSNEIDLSRYQFASTGYIQEEDQVGDNSQDGNQEDEDPKEDGYVPPDEPESVPGADITLRAIDGGLAIESDDLSALEDAVDLIYDLLDQESEADLPAIFYLKYRRADGAKAILDQLLGLADSSGGGGGSLMGDMVGGMVSNALGPAGDLFGGLLGGGSGGASGGSYLLEGDVSTAIDLRLNTLIVQGHTINDYEVIATYIDYIDQKQPPNFLQFDVGRMRKIPIVYRDAEFIREKVTNALGPLIDDGEEGGGGGGQQNQAQDMARVMQAMMRGNGGGGAASNFDPESEKPKGKLDVDTEQPGLIFTGPDFIYEMVLQMVATLDTRESTEGQKSITISLNGELPPELLAEALKSIYQGTVNIEIAEGAESSGGSGSSSRSTSSPTGNTASGQAQREAMQRAMIQQAIQSRGGFGGGQTRGGSSRGGGSGGGRGGSGRR